MKGKIFLNTIILSFLICSCGSSKTPISKEEAEEITKNYSYNEIDTVTLDYSFNFETLDGASPKITLKYDLNIVLDTTETSPFYFYSLSGIFEKDGIISKNDSFVLVFESIINGDNYKSGNFQISPSVSLDRINEDNKDMCAFTVRTSFSSFIYNLYYSSVASNLDDNTNYFKTSNGLYIEGDSTQLRHSGIMTVLNTGLTFDISSATGSYNCEFNEMGNL